MRISHLLLRAVKTHVPIKFPSKPQATLSESYRLQNLVLKCQHLSITFNDIFVLHSGNEGYGGHENS